MGPEHFWGGGMWIFPALFLAILLVMLYLVFARDRAPRSESTRHSELLPRSETALEIVEKRYARGEINREEYQQMKNDLS